MSLIELNNLNSINLSLNKIKELKNLNNLEYLNISKNLISFLPNLINIIEIDLTYNLIEEINLNFLKLEIIDLSFNKIKIINFINLNNLKILKLTNNPLNFNFNFNLFPKLKILDITNTLINLIEIPKKLQEIKLSNKEYLKLNQFNINFIENNNNNFGYSDSIGNRENMEDFILIRKNILNNIDLFGIFDGHGGFQCSNLIGFSIPLLIEKLKEININNIFNLILNFNNTLK